MTTNKSVIGTVCPQNSIIPGLYGQSVPPKYIETLPTWPLFNLVVL